MLHSKEVWFLQLSCLSFDIRYIVNCIRKGNVRFQFSKMQVLQEVKCEKCHNMKYSNQRDSTQLHVCVLLILVTATTEKPIYRNSREHFQCYLSNVCVYETLKVSNDRPSKDEEFNSNIFIAFALFLWNIWSRITKH